VWSGRCRRLKLNLLPEAGSHGRVQVLSSPRFDRPGLARHWRTKAERIVALRFLLRRRRRRAFRRCRIFSGAGRAVRLLYRDERLHRRLC